MLIGFSGILSSAERCESRVGFVCLSLQEACGKREAILRNRCFAAREKKRKYGGTPFAQQQDLQETRREDFLRRMPANNSKEQ